MRIEGTHKRLTAAETARTVFIFVAKCHLDRDPDPVKMAAAMNSLLMQSSISPNEIESLWRSYNDFMATNGEAN